MKTRIFFVDDDPMLLASTRRQLRRKLGDCELLFFEKALDPRLVDSQLESRWSPSPTANRSGRAY